MGLNRFWDRISRHQKATSSWDDAIVNAGNHGRDAARLMRAAQRDFARADFYWDYEDALTYFPASTPDALDFLAGKMHAAAEDIRKAAGEKDADGAGATWRQNTAIIWDLEEIKDAVIALIPEDAS